MSRIIQAVDPTLIINSLIFHKVQTPGCVCVCVCVCFSFITSFFSKSVIFRHAILAFNRLFLHNLRYHLRPGLGVGKSYKKMGLFALYICFLNYNL